MATATRKRARRSSGEHANDPVTSVAGAAAPRPGGEAALVPRTPLVRRLLAARGAPLAMVVAPAGYGKSVLLTQWAERDERRFAWMRAAEEHNDPVRLIGALAETLCQAGVFTEDLATAIADARDVAPARMLASEPHNAT